MNYSQMICIFIIIQQERRQFIVNMDLNLVIKGEDQPSAVPNSTSHDTNDGPPDQSPGSSRVPPSNDSSSFVGLKEIDEITEQDRVEENARILESRKDSQLSQKLEMLRKQQITLKMYNDQISQYAITNSYRRFTNLDKPEDPNAPIVVIASDDLQHDSKLNKEEQIDNLEIKMQYMPIFDDENSPNLLQMNIDADIFRLCQMYLKNLNQLKKSLPSLNVENRHYEKEIQQYAVPTNRANVNLFMVDYQGKTAGSKPNQNNQSVRESVTGSVSTSLLMEQTRSESMMTMQTNRSNSVSTLDNYNGATKIDMKIIQVQCEPTLIRSDQVRQEQLAKVAAWQDFLSELQTNPHILALVIKRMMEDGYDDQGIMDETGYDVAHSTALVNLGQFFWDSIHTEERLAFSENNNFIKFFSSFATQFIRKEHFYKDEMDNIKIKDNDLRETITCLFEGLTRKIPAFNYLRFVFQQPFNRINLFSIEQDLFKIAGFVPNKRSGSTTDLNESMTQKEEVKVEKKGFWGQLWGKIAGKDEKKGETKKPLADGEMIFDNKNDSILESFSGDMHNSQRDSYAQSQSFLANSNNERLFDSLASIYGGETDPFSYLKVFEAKDDKQKLERYDAIESEIQKGYVNTHKFLMQNYPNFKPNQTQKIIMNDKDIRSSYIERQNVKSVANEIPNQSDKPTKNLTYYLKSLVQKNFEQMLNFSNKIPFSIRAMLKILIIRSRGGGDNYNIKIKPTNEEIHLLASILIAGWMNVGYRNPKCFGIQPSELKELELEYVLFQAARIVFEHMMLMLRLPDEYVLGFEIDELNKFITQMSSQVLIFWSRLIFVDLSEIYEQRQPEAIQSNMLRIDDLQLLYIYSSKVVLDVSNGLLRPPEMEPDSKEKWSQFCFKYKALDSLVKGDLEYQEEGSFINGISQKWLLPKNRTGFTLSKHFQKLLSIEQLDDAKPFEYFMIFFNKRSQTVSKSDLENWRLSCLGELKNMNQQFVVEKLAQGAPPLKLKHNQSFDQVSVRAGRTRQASEMVKREAFLKQNSVQVRSSQQLPLNHYSGVQELPDTRQIRLHRLQPNNVPVHQVQSLLFNIFNSLRVLVDQPHFRIECLRDHASREEVKDLVALLVSAERANRDLPQPVTQIQVGCLHIIRIMKLLNLEGHFELQNRIMNHFLKLIEQQIKTARRYLDQMIITMDVLAVDVQRFESNVTQMKQFHTKYENNQQFMEKISRYNPEVCLLECFKFSLSEEWKPYKGLLLNMSCQYHQNNVPFESQLIFGGINRRLGQKPVEVQVEPRQILSEIEMRVKIAKDKRILRFRELYYLHNTFTVSLQNTDQKEMPFDQQIKHISEFIKYFTDRKRGQPHLRTLIRCDDKKYESLMDVGIVLIPEGEDGKPMSKQDQIIYMRSQEPLDFMNIVRTYTMFLQHISVLASTTIKEKHVNEIEDSNWRMKQHYDFLQCDLPSKSLRYSIHDYIMKRLHKTIFSSQKETEMDKHVQKLILAKKDDPEWVLTSPQSQALLKAGRRDQVTDFSKTPEWCDPMIYTASLKILLKVQDETTPHMKAMYIEDAMQQAYNAMKIATPYKVSSDIGAYEQQRVSKYLLLELCKIFEKAKTNPRLYSQLLYVILFNVPHNEQMYYTLLKQQNQNHSLDPSQERDFAKLPLHVQHTQTLGVLCSRYRAYQWFDEIKTLIYQDQVRQAMLAKQNPQQAKQMQKSQSEQQLRK